MCTFPYSFALEFWDTLFIYIYTAKYRSMLEVMIMPIIEVTDNKNEHATLRACISTNLSVKMLIIHIKIVKDMCVQSHCFDLPLAD